MFERFKDIGCHVEMTVTLRFQHTAIGMKRMIVQEDPRLRQRPVEVPRIKMPGVLGGQSPPAPMKLQVAETAHRSGYTNVKELLQQTTNQRGEVARIGSLHSMRLKLLPEDIKSAFDNIDLDRNDFISTAELKHILAQTGVTATDQELDNMIKMADTDGKGQVGWDEFLLLFTKPFTLFSKVDLSELEEIRHVMNTKDPDEYRGPEVSEAVAISGVRPVGISRDARLAIMDEFGHPGENYIRPTHLKKLYERFHEVDLDGSGDIGFDEFCTAMKGTKNMHLCQQLFSMFDIDGSNSISLREFIIGLSNFTKASVQEAQLLAFQLYDVDNSGTIDEGELTRLISSNFATCEEVTEADIKKKINLVYRSLNLEKERLPLDKKMWLDATRLNPHLVAPVLDLQETITSHLGRIKDSKI